MSNATKLFAAIGAALVFGALLVDARPPGPFSLSLNLNGEASRQTIADGGGNGLFSTGTTVATATIRCGLPHKAVCPATAVNICTNAVDAGCSNDITSPQYGEPIAEGDFLYWVAQDCPGSLTKTIAAISTTDAGVSCAVFEMR